MNPEENPFAYMSVEEIKSMMGTKIQSMEESNELDHEVDVPAQFDARVQWPQYIHDIRDQAKCGSCWAFGASEALSDRLAIASKGKENHVLSAQSMVSCDKLNMGCNGGVLSFAWLHLRIRGIPTEQCFPYTSQAGKVEACRSKCVDGSAMHNFKVGGSTSTSNVNKIKESIAKDGPVETGFTVYEDFMNYKSGVYHHVSGKQLGGHAVKILGWGHDDASGLDYWIAANSWNTTWGDNGFFKIKIGDCGVNSMIFASAVVPKSVSE
jgi:cathepsin B